MKMKILMRPDFYHGKLTYSTEQWVKALIEEFESYKKYRCPLHHQKVVIMPGGEEGEYFKAGASFASNGNMMFAPEKAVRLMIEIDFFEE